TVRGRGFRFVAPIANGDRTSGLSDGASPEQTMRGMATKPSVAVLPFVNFNQDSSEDAFADGMAEDITTALAKNRWLTVIARNPAFAFRGSRESMKVIGGKLAADYLVTGSMRRGGTRFRI